VDNQPATNDYTGAQWTAEALRRELLDMRAQRDTALNTPPANAIRVAMILPIPYTYWTQVAAVHDGDTVSLDIDLGFNTWLHPGGINAADPARTSFRLYRCNARELDQPGGPEARDHLAELFELAGGRVLVTSIRNDKFGGRYDATRDMAAAEYRRLVLQIGGSS
jgi:hypothetical protein